MENLIAFGALAAIFYLLILPIIAIVAMSRANEAKRLVEALRKKLVDAEATIATSAARATEPEGAGARAAATVTPAAEPAVLAEPVTPPFEPIAAPEPPPATVPQTRPATPEPAREARPALAVAASPAQAIRRPAPEPVQPGRKTPAPAPAAATAKKTAPAAARAHEAEDANPLSGVIGWFLKGNPLAKIGALLLFFGLAYLFKYSVDHDLLPIELRLAGAGLFSLVLLAIGWRLRVKQPLYGLILQGTAVGAFYLTAFAAFRLYALLPHGAVFALMVVICAASVVLSVLQRAQSLAVIAALGGYLAPVLLSTGGGSHVALFSYYAMLSVGILAVSVWQIWRPLNLIGFVFTFGVAALWARGSYVPDFYPSCQFFLILNFLIFGIAAPLAALRRDTKALRFVDGTLVFGTPLLAFGMQYGLMREQGWSMGAAYACLVLGAIYLPLARALMRRWPEAGRRMALSFIALGGGFVTLAIPLALAARWTALAWALEGLGLVWVGLGQQHRKMAWSGTLLIALACVSAGFAWPLDTLTMLLIFGVLALSCLAAGLFWSRETALPEARPISIALWIAGIGAWLYWIFDGSERLLVHYWLASLSPFAELDAILWDQRPTAALAGLAGTALSACAWMFAGERLRWRLLRHSGWLLWPLAALVFGQLVALTHHSIDGWYGAGVWALVLAAVLLILRRTENDIAVAQTRMFVHSSLCWLILAVGGTEVGWRLTELPWGFDTLQPALAIAALALAILAVVLASRRPWPVRAHPAAWWLVGLAPVAPLMLLALLCGNLFDGELFGWPYVPLINPLEEAAAFALLMLCLWRRPVGEMRPNSRQPTALAIGVLAAWWFNGAIVRALAHYGDIAWNFDALWNSRLVQTTLALVWTLAALVLMAIAKRRASRPVWITGATVLGLVVVKLFLVDSARGGGLARAVAFIGVAVLVLLIGYIAPLPPRKTPDAERPA